MWVAFLFSVGMEHRVSFTNYEVLLLIILSITSLKLSHPYVLLTFNFSSHKIKIIGILYQIGIS